MKLRYWAKRRHPIPTWRKVASKYRRLETGHWRFATKTGLQLYRHSQTTIRRYIRVKGDRSPYDGDWIHWASRLGCHPELPKRVAILLQRQKGKCAWCELQFKNEDLLEIDHIIPITYGGKDEYNNWQLLYGHCHDEKSILDVDMIEMDIPGRALNVELTEEVIVGRLKDWRPPEPRTRIGFLALYAQLAMPADQGAAMQKWNCRSTTADRVPQR